MVGRTATLVAASMLLSASPATAQDEGMQMPMGHMHMTMQEAPLGIGHVRDGSGTSWLPDASPMDGLMRTMAHGR